jgi:hypothetical protein
VIGRIAMWAAAVVFLAAACMPARSSSQSVGWQVRGASLVGDVDGDGSTDEVAVEDAGSRSCRFRVRARTSRVTLTTPLRLGICAEKPAETWGTARPSVIGLAAIDRQPGLEIVIELGCGAHTCFATVFGFDGRVLREWEVPLETIAYGGSVGTGSRSIDCAGKGIVVGSTLNWRTSSVHRTWYRARGGRLEHIRARKSSSRGARLAPRPFAGCTVVSPGD